MQCIASAGAGEVHASFRFEDWMARGASVGGRTFPPAHMGPATAPFCGLTPQPLRITLRYFAPNPNSRLVNRNVARDYSIMQSLFAAAHRVQSSWRFGRVRSFTRPRHLVLPDWRSGPGRFAGEWDARPGRIAPIRGCRAAGMSALRFGPSLSVHPSGARRRSGPFCKGISYLLPNHARPQLAQ